MRSAALQDDPAFANGEIHTDPTRVVLSAEDRKVS